MSSTSTARAIRAILAVQIVIAILLFARDIAGTLPQIAFTPRAPDLDNPIGPGDQTRRYDPAHLPPPASAPGTDVPVAADMPTRLQFAADPTRPGVVRITGTIAPGDYDRFRDWQATTSLTVDRVTLHSPGGSVSDALAIGRALREAGIATEIRAGDICLSACPYLLAAGTTRTVGENAYIGVHQHYFDESSVLPAFLAVEDIQRGQGAVLDYLIDMDIDLRVMRHALVTPPNQIYILTPEELSDYRLVTPTEAATDTES